MAGPLRGIKIVEFAGIGPGPHSAMMLADMGADVVRIVRPSRAEMQGDTLLRNRKTVEADLKDPQDIERVIELVNRADVLIEGFRPGVMERLGLGPATWEDSNTGLIYGRITGWGQEGEWSSRPGHDINYISITGILEATGTKETPVIPLNLYGDFGGGSMLLVNGILAALVNQKITGIGQTVDAAMVDGVSQLSQMMWSYRASGMWQEQRASNILDGGAHFYNIYECKDGKHIAVGAIEPQFYAALLQQLELPLELLKTQHDKNSWPEMKQKFSTIFLTKTRDEWSDILDGTDACVTPILSMSEAIAHPHMQSRKIFSEIGGTIQPLSAPRFSKTKPDTPQPPNDSTFTFSELFEAWK